MRPVIFLLIFFLLAQITDLIAQSNNNRLALVIGNAAYQYGGVLKNPVNDAELMNQTLKNLDFEIITRTNATLESMRSAFKEFATRLPDYDVALFFYAGHGMQIDGENYLIPIDAKLEDKLSMEFEAFKVNTINRYFAMNSDNLNIMILDACRNNPYRSWMRGSGSGFTTVKEQGAGTIIAFATREGETASDGTGNNGLFTEHLVKQMYISQNITDVFQNTRVSVIAASNKQQIPQEWNMLTGNFYFTGRSNTKTISTPVNKPKPIMIATPSVHLLGTSEENFVLGPSSFIDPRNNSTYSTIGIVAIISNGRKVPMIWMTKNVNYETHDSYVISGSKERLYTWNAAGNACPVGWHMPSQEEWRLLVSHYGGVSIAGHALKSSYGWSDKSWNVSGNGSNSSGFNALPLGYRNDFGTFTSQKNGAFFWTSTSKDESNAIRLTFYYNESGVEIDNAHKYSAYSCRCILD